MKKLKLIMILLAVVFVFGGCSNSNNDFTEVSRITFTSSGQTRTIYPTWYITTDSFTYSTKAEYDEAEFKSSVMAPSNVDEDTILLYTADLFSGNIYTGAQNKPYKPYGISVDNIGEYFFIYTHDLGYYFQAYFKVEIKDVGANYIQVKVINDTTIIIKNGNIETTYTVTSYSIIN